MNQNNRKAFTMLELIFVIVVIGILSAVAIPKFAANRDSAVISKAKTTVAAVRNAVATERQKRILKGDFTPITGLSQNAANIFDTFSPDSDDNAAGRASGGRVLEYPVSSCATLGKSDSCWTMNGTNYSYVLPASMGNVDFSLNGGRFDCVIQDANCMLLTQ